MTTFARLINGVALDCQIGTVSDLATRFHPVWLSKNPFTEVPDGTLHGAKDNGDGTFSNPVIVQPALIDLILSKSDFIDHCSAQLGSAATGQVRFGAIIAAARASTDGAVAFGISKYDSLSAVTKAQAQAFFTAIRQAGLPGGAIVTVAEITAIVTNWPKA